MTFEEMFNEYWKFAEKTFDTRSHEATKGLIREAKELDDVMQVCSEVREYELEEMADVQFYLIYVLKKSGGDIGDLISAMKEKLEVLKTRKWKKDETGFYSHIK